MINWYDVLKKIDNEEKIEFIVVEENNYGKWLDGEKLKQSSGKLEDVKSMLDYKFDDGYGGTNGLFLQLGQKTKSIFQLVMMAQNGLLAYPETHV